MSNDRRPAPWPPYPTGSEENPLRPPIPGQAGPVNANPGALLEPQIRENANRITQAFPQFTELNAKNALIRCGGSLPGAVKLLLSQRDQGRNINVSNDRAPSARPAPGKGREEVIDLTSDGSPSPPPAKGKGPGSVIDLTSDGSPSPPRAKEKGPEDVIDLASDGSPSPLSAKGKGIEEINHATNRSSTAPPAKDKDYTNTGPNTPTVQIQPKPKPKPKPKTYIISEKVMHVLLSASETHSPAANMAALDWVKAQDPQLKIIMKTKSGPRDGVEMILYKCVERLEEEAKKLVREDMQRLVSGITKVAEVKIQKGIEKQEVNQSKVLPIPVGRSKLYGIIDKEYLKGGGEAALTNFVEMWESKSDRHRLNWGSAMTLAKDVARVTKTLHQMLLLDVEYTHMDERGKERWAVLVQNYGS